MKTKIYLLFIVVLLTLFFTQCSETSKKCVIKGTVEGVDAKSTDFTAPDLEGNLYSYLLINEKGEIVNKNAKRPSQLKELEKHLI